MDITPRPLAGMSILLVDDDGDGRDLLDFFLTEYGAVVTTAASAVDAVERFKASPPAIVISDIAMPMRDGVWLLQQLRALPPRVPMIALTALARTKERDEFLAAGFDAYISKPTELKDILRVVLSLLGRG